MEACAIVCSAEQYLLDHPCISIDLGNISCLHNVKCCTQPRSVKSSTSSLVCKCCLKTHLLVLDTPTDLRSFELRFESAVRFDSKGIGRFENFQIKSAVTAPLLAVILVKRLKPLTALSGIVYRLDSSMSDHTLAV